MKMIAALKRKKVKDVAEAQIKEYLTLCEQYESKSDEEKSDAFDSIVQARQKYVKYLQVTLGRSPLMAWLLIEWMQENNVQFCIAPYEAEW